MDCRWNWLRTLLYCIHRNLQILIFVRSTGADYALKIIDKSKCHGKEHMIESEVSILRRVHHPNIIHLVAEYDTHSELYLVMELVKVSIRSQLHFVVTVGLTFKDRIIFTVHLVVQDEL
jgi:serine/threonine protein kinase